VTFDLDLDLEHTVDAGSPGDHRVQVWSQSRDLRARKSDFRSSTKMPVSRDAGAPGDLGTSYMHADLGPYAKHCRKLVWK